MTLVLIWGRLLCLVFGHSREWFAHIAPDEQSAPVYCYRCHGRLRDLYISKRGE